MSFHSYLVVHPESLHVPWRIENILPPGITLLYGKEKIGKTFLAISWAHCVATHQAWCGRDVRGAPVAYVLNEGGASEIQRRKAACRTFFGGDDSELLFDEKVYDLVNGPDALRDSLYECEPSPGLLVIDTLASNLCGDDNVAGDVNRAVHSLRNLRQQFEDMDILVIHHEPQGGHRPRGHQHLTYNADAVWRLTSDLDLQCINVRCAPKGGVISLVRRNVDISQSGPGNIGVIDVDLYEREYAALAMELLPEVRQMTEEANAMLGKDGEGAEELFGKAQHRGMEAVYREVIATAPPSAVMVVRNDSAGTHNPQKRLTKTTSKKQRAIKVLAESDGLGLADWSRAVGIPETTLRRYAKAWQGDGTILRGQDGRFALARATTSPPPPPPYKGEGGGGGGAVASDTRPNDVSLEVGT